MEKHFQRLDQGCPPFGGTGLIVTPRVPSCRFHGPRRASEGCSGPMRDLPQLFSAVRFRGVVCAGNFRLRFCEFVWGVKMLTEGVLNTITLRRRIDARPKVALSFKTKKKIGQTGLYGGVNLSARMIEGTE